jgi:Holliday junction resolvasome RuvABC endonuclease subunit
MNFVGIDPGTNNAAYAVVDSEGQRVCSGQFNLARDIPSTTQGWDNALIRLRRLANYTEDLFESLSPKIAAVGIEWMYVGKNLDTALKLSVAWGIIASPVLRRGYPLLRVAPSVARALMYSYQVDDETLIDIAKRMGALCEKPGGEDEACAIGVALEVRKKILGL